MFNIGAEGQVIVGGVAAVVVGFSFAGMPPIIHVPLALLAGAVAGALWASIAGWLRAATGAHEVIITIMLNLIAMRLLDYLLRNPPIQKEGRADPISKNVLPSAELPHLFDWLDPLLRVHAGIFVVMLAVIFIWWLLFRSTIGFEFRAAGLNPEAARYAGMRSGLIIVLVMALAGALAGLAGANQVLGVLGRVSPNFSGGVGFDAIAVALLGRSHPVGVLLAGLLFGALQAGGRQMQVDAGVSLDVIAIIQALIIIFIAAPMLMRGVFPSHSPNSQNARWTQPMAATQVSKVSKPAISPTRLRQTRLIGVILLILSVFVAVFFAWPVSGDASFRLAYPGDAFPLPNLIVPAAPYAWVVAALLAFSGCASSCPARHAGPGCFSASACCCW
ncbi:MAG: ABC transporter permease [Nitratireductor sp.]